MNSMMELSFTPDLFCSESLAEGIFFSVVAAKLNVAGFYPPSLLCGEARNLVLTTFLMLR